MPKKKFLYALLIWICLSAVLGAIVIFIHIAVQQDLRQSANDPQIQIAEDAAAKLDAKADPVSLVPNESIDLKQSLAPFIMIFDSSHDLIVGNAILDGTAPALPEGVFDTSAWVAPIVGHHFTWMNSANENRFTWEPQTGVREAVVLIRAQNGEYVAVGRSLREVEKREGALTFETLLVFFLVSAVSLIGTLLVVFIFLKRRYQ